MIDVIVVGAGPTGMLLAAELRVQGVDVVVLQRDSERNDHARGLGLHVRSIELLDQRGLLPDFLAMGRQYPIGGSFGGIRLAPLDPSDTAHAYILDIPQNVTERLLTEHAERLGVRIHRGHGVVALGQDGEAVTVELADGERLQAQYVVGCDGGRSTVRSVLGIGFPGEPSRIDRLLGDFEVGATAEAMAAVAATVPTSLLAFGPGPGQDGVHRFVVRAEQVAADRTAVPTFTEFRDRLRAVAGTDFGICAPRWLSRFGDATRLADSYRSGRVLLAGDAAHIHPPIGGAGPQPRNPGRLQPGVETGGRDPRLGFAGPAGQLPGRAAPGRRRRPGGHPGPDGAARYRARSAGGPVGDRPARRPGTGGGPVPGPQDHCDRRSLRPGGRGPAGRRPAA